MSVEIDARARDIARAIGKVGGRALVVGGFVRDHILGMPCKDLDIEIFDLPLEELERVLSGFGEIATIGRAFGVLRIKGLDVDFSMPRRDSKVAEGHTGFTVEFDPTLDFAAAARRRDLTLNSMAIDPLTGEILDPHGGRRDIEAKVLRATDPAHFSEDPLRGLRVAQFAARFDMQPDDELRRLCEQLDLSELSAERLFEEFRKLLLKGRRPSVGFEFLRQTKLLRFFPELEALIDVPQEPQWHPEGDVWVHTMMAIDEAACLRDGGDDDLAMMLGVLCHDFGKPETTVERDGRIRSPAHDTAGVAVAERFLERLRTPVAVVEQVAALVRHHLAPALFVKNGATAKGYRRLARKLDANRVSVALLVRVAKADHWGRTTEEAKAHSFVAADAFVENARSLLLEHQGPKDVVMGRHLVARGMQPGPQFKEILDRCRDYQDASGWDDPERILQHVLGS